MRRLLVTLLISGLAAVAQRTYDCGDLGQRTCGWKDFEYYNMQWKPNKCEADLKERDDICVNDQRQTRVNSDFWLRWVLNEQYYSISKHRPINRVPWVGTHNAFSSRPQGFNNDIYANQGLSLTDQLNMGSRHLELDPHYYELETGQGALRACHASSTAICRVPGYGTRLFGVVLREIRTWLKNNPDEVLIIKLNEKSLPGDRYDDLYDELVRYLGSRTYRPVSGLGRWPTISEIRAAGKQVVLMQHDTPVTRDGETLVWNAYRRILANNWPKNQDVENCVASDGVSQANRGGAEWWDIAEGRSLSNTEPLDATGSIGTTYIRKAVKCGASILGLDYFHTLPQAPVGSGGADQRLRAAVWSFDEEDYGWAGPAALIPTAQGRWQGIPITTERQFACAKVRANGDPNEFRDWKVTAAKMPWNKAIGNAQCVSEFGASYEFSFPANGYENEQLMDVARQQGVVNAIWLAYSTNPQAPVGATTTDVTFTVTPGGPMPPAEGIVFFAPAGSVASAEVSVPWVVPVGLAPAVVVPGTYRTNVELVLKEPVVRAMAPGVYKTVVVLRSTINAGGPAPIPIPLPVDVTLIIKKPISLTLTTSSPNVPFNLPVRLIATLPVADPKPTGTITFVRTSAPDPTSATISAPIQGSEARVDIPGLPAGKHRFAGVYDGDAYYQHAESGEIEITILPRIRVTPSPVEFTMTHGGPNPAPIALAVGSASAGLGASTTCGWLTAVVGSQISVTLTPLAAQTAALWPAVHECSVTLSDSLSSTQGSTMVTVRLNVRTTLSVSPDTLNLLTGTDGVLREVVLSTPGNGTLPLESTTTAGWLTVLPGATTAPTNARIGVNPIGLAPGTHTGKVRFTSALATNAAEVSVTLKVVRPTTVDSSPSGKRLYVDSAPVTTPATFIWEPGSVHTLSADTVQMATPSDGTRFRFVSWSQGGPQTQTVTAALLGGLTYAALLTPEHRLSVNAVPSNAGTVSPNPASADGFYPHNAQVQLTAVPGIGKFFSGWMSGDVSGTQNPVTVLMNGPVSAVAGFADLAPVNVTIQSNVPSSVTVSGTAYPVPGVVPMVPGVSYQLVAQQESQVTATSKWRFKSWLAPLIASNAFAYLAPSSPAVLTVAYEQMYLVTATPSPAAGGTVSGTGFAPAGSQISLLATPNPGYAFSGFSGSGLGTGSPNPAMLTVNAPVVVVANFRAQGAPALYVTTAGSRADGPGVGQRRVPIVVRNGGSGHAVDARITGVTNVQVLSGTGPVTSATAVPLALGTIAAGGSQMSSLIFDWPATASRIQFTVQFQAANGYLGSTTLNVIR